MEFYRGHIATNYCQESADRAVVYEDEGFSGKHLERPQFKKMMVDFSKMKFTAIVVYRLDRISWNTGDLAKLSEDLKARKIEFTSANEQYDRTIEIRPPTGRKYPHQLCLGGSGHCDHR